MVASLLALAVTLTFHSKTLDEDRTVMVQVPADYARVEERYPVLYVTDAETQFEQTASSVAFLAAANRIPQLIVVGIVNTNRRRDLTPTAAALPTAGGKPVPQPGSGGGPKFLAFVETELVPEIDRRYRTRPFRVIAGHSFGGLFAVWAAEQRPSLFRGVIVASPTLYWDDDLALKQLPDVRLYAAIAKESPQMRRAFEALRAKQRPSWRTELLADEDHASIPLPAYYAGLKHVFAPWHFSIDELPEDPAKWEAAVREHYAKASAFLGYEVKPPAWVLEEITTAPSPPRTAPSPPSTDGAPSHAQSPSSSARMRPDCQSRRSA